MDKFASPTGSNDQSKNFECDDGIFLNGIWKIPTGPTKACALILQGSGNIGMDGEVSSPILGFPYKSEKAPLSEQLAISLAEVGVASFRYSKRGFEDPDQLKNQITDYLAKDAERAALLIRLRFPSNKLFGVAFSEGAILALLIADSIKWDGLFLFGLPTRPINQIFSYQFLSWPTTLFKSRLKSDPEGLISKDELSKLASEFLPLLGAPWQTIGNDDPKSLSISKQIIPAYEALLTNVLQVMQSPPYAGWYNSMKKLPDFKNLASQTLAPVWLYHGNEDAQVSIEWILEDQTHFPGKRVLRNYPGLGHCFSPHDGHFGEVKTSGPIQAQVIEDLKQDLREALIGFTTS